MELEKLHEGGSLVDLEGLRQCRFLQRIAKGRILANSNWIRYRLSSRLVQVDECFDADRFRGDGLYGVEWRWG